MMSRKTLLFMPSLLAALMMGCSSTTIRVTDPTQTANQQLLISAAADNAAAKLDFDLPVGTRFFLDAQYFGITSGSSIYQDAKSYAVSMVGNTLLQQGYRVVAKRDDADMVVEIRLGGLSINKVERNYLQIPSFSIPIPLSGSFTVPQIDFVVKREQQGIAKIAATAYDVKDGLWRGTVGPVFGFSHLTFWKVFFISWVNSDLVPVHDEAELYEGYKGRP